MTNANVTILGCGSSGGVPRIGNNWGACDPDNPKNRRRRCSILIKRIGDGGETNVLVDTSPDMRDQLLSVNVGWLDGVLFTHEHADHIHGIDDLRVVAMNGRERISVYLDEQTSRLVTNRFSYCFKTPADSPYPPILIEHRIAPGKAIEIAGKGGSVTVLPFDQIHGHIRSLGFRVGNVAYSSDLSDLPDETIPLLKDLDVWIVDALRYTPHPTHFSLEEAVQWIDRIKPRRAILTNMHVDLDYDTLQAELPDHIEPAFDGLAVDLNV